MGNIYPPPVNLEVGIHDFCLVDSCKFVLYLIVSQESEKVLCLKDSDILVVSFVY